MKIQDLDRNQIYDLRGITHEQAEELLQWLIENDTNWNDCDLKYLVSHNNILFDINWNEWLLSFYHNEQPTTHISTLFEEQSYEEQLIEAVKRVEILKEKVKQLKELEIGDVCKFWDEDENEFIIGKLKDVYTNCLDCDISFPYVLVTGSEYKHAKKLTQQEVIELLFNK